MPIVPPRTLARPRILAHPGTLACPHLAKQSHPSPSFLRPLPSDGHASSLQMPFFLHPLFSPILIDVHTANPNRCSHRQQSQQPSHDPPIGKNILFTRHAHPVKWLCQVDPGGQRVLAAVLVQDLVGQDGDDD
eukprot:331161-Chlamydomonas_euryale.AAC.1